LPRAGYLTIFDRSWYGRVLVERVEGLATVSAWQRAYSEINDFEEQLCDRGIVLLKFWLHIDPDEQLRRFQERENTPYKKYKITQEDYRNRDQWPLYEQAVHDMVLHTSTDYAPWHLIPSNNKRWARIEVLKTYCQQLEKRL
jgi:polyphosphate kinase 2 (PPK2 family)